ncbi:MAG: cell wall-associated protease [Solirubrobacteraceae bacterium]|nr:cell wall-associated protease [Solirubrobacteraceae bacterium]
MNLGDAVQLAQKGALPPEAAIWSPDWFAPLTGANVPITGRARARSGSFHYKLEWGVGETPSTWTTAKEGDASGTVTDFGTIDMNAVRAALAGYVVPPDSGAPVFSATSPNPFSREWTVRLVVTQAGVPTPGIDRRVFDGIDDATLKPGFPKKTGAGGEAPIRYADLNGDDKPELIVPLEDGTVHAYDAVTGDDLPGFPVKTDLLLQAANHASAPGVAAVSAVAPPREPPRAITLGDLDGDGRPELITTAGRHIYVWETDGTRRPGFPVSIDPSFCRAADQSQELHHRKCGFLASAAIADIGGKAIVAPALDGHVYAVRPDGSSVPHFPVDLVDTGIAAPDRMYAESINSPAIGDLDGDGFDDVVVASNESYGAADPGSTDILSDVLANGAGGSSRLYAISGKTGAFLPGWPVKLNGAIQSTLPLIGPGHDAAIAKLGGQTRVIASTTGSAGIKTIGVDGSVAQTMQQSAYGATSDATDRAGSINLFESAVVGDVLGTGTPAIVKYGISLSQVVNLLLVGQNVPYNHLINAFDATTGVPLPAFPRVTDDYQFLSSSTIAKVGGTGVSNQVLAGNGLGMLHAYDGLTGLDAPGFPKITGGWLFAPAALSDDGRMAGITREGYLFQWTSSAPKCQPAGVWDAFRHDEHGSGNLDADGTPPGTPADVKLTPAAAGMWTLEFTSPGDDRFCGTPAKYTVSTGDIGTGVSAAGTKVTRTLALPDSGGLALGATDEVGNRGVPAVILFNRSSGAATPTPGPGVSPSPTPTPTSTVPAVTPTPSPGGGDNNTGCTGPRTVGRVRHRGVRRLRGRARRGTCARIKRVKVAVRLRIGARRCRAVKRSGALGHVTPCRRTGHFLRAHGKRRWRLRFRTPLAPGGYTVRVRVIDKAGHRSRARTRHFRIR